VLPFPLTLVERTKVKGSERETEEKKEERRKKKTMEARFRGKL